jgi:hypothetical protein
VWLAALALAAACASLPDPADMPRAETLASQLGLALQTERDTRGSWPLDGRDFLRRLESMRAAFQSDGVLLAMMPEPAFIADLRLDAQRDGSLRVAFRPRARGAETFEFNVSTNKVTLSPGAVTRPRQP